MICKGIRHEEGVPETCDSISLCDDMASMCVARWDRRKQANPKRTNNVDDIPLEADLHDPDNVQTADTTGHTSGQNDVLTSGNPQPEASDNNDKSDETNDRQMAPLSDEPVVTEIGDDVRAASPTPSNVRQEDVTDDVTTTATSLTTTTTTNGYHGSQAEERGVTMVTEEDENIQELMGRSDTVVIFPEPVSDHEEGNNTTENEGDLDEDLAKCPHCERAYPQLELLKEHWHGAHAGQTSKHCCPQCGISFLTKGHLDKHIALHSPSAQICKICRKTFANVYRLQRHMISHEESTELRKFKCPECQKAFKFKHHLKEHIRIHSGEKPFECQNCGKRFSHSGSYSSHMTSKKCWIVNMKMRSSASVGRLDKAVDGSGQTLVPKTLENNVDMNLASMMYGSGLLGQRFLPYAGAQFQAPYIGQMNGTQSPFLSPNPLTSAMSTTIIPGLTNVTAFGCLPPGCADKEAKVSGSQSETAAGSASPTQQVKDTDENMNRKMKSEGETVTEPRTSTTATTTTTTAEGQRTEQAESQVKVKTEPNPEGADAGEKTAASAGQHDHKQQQAAADDDDTTDAGAKSEPGEDGSHTLTALASAATQQLQQLMKESKCCDVKTEPKADADSEPGGQPGGHTCKYCRQEFASPISLHQHERYLCKQNDEIRHGEVPAMPNGAICSAATGSHDEATDECSESERKIRVRSMITDEQVQILKSFYQTNQRPNKFELETLAQQIGFPKRVVQVWFQNMRARDRRKGRTVRDGKPTAGSVEAQHVSSSSGAVGYIPIVPQVSPPAALGNYYNTSGTVPKTTGPTAALYNTSASPQRACEASFEAEQPLDLTVKVPQAHTSKPYSSQPDPPGADEVLNLSVKDVSGHPNKENSPTPATVAEHALPASCKSEDRQPTGGSTGPHDGTRPSSDGSTGPPVALVVPVVSVPPPPPPPPQINTTPAHSNSYASMTSMPYRLAFNQTPSLAHHHQQYENGAKPAAYEPGLPLASSPSLCSGELMSPRPNSLDSSFNTGISLESNPDTAAAAAATYRMSQKTKRPRKKSWRQVGGAVESEEMQDLDESVDEDSDSPLRKKRRSWKQHRVDVAEGLYACDQCDKMFSKQSSLARHKYEHSGQRPFPCDICTKAFKHKHHLTEHKRLHSGEKPFQCQKCGKRFSHSGSYSQHMNHRYKYCKPLLGDDCDNGEVDMETEHSEASP